MLRDKLITLLSKYYNTYAEENFVCYFTEYEAEDIADYILADGWIKPPCQIGTKVYKIACTNCNAFCGVTGLDCDDCPYENKNVIEGTVIAIKLTNNVRLKVKFPCYVDYFGEDELYFTKEEAERKLKELKNGNGNIN